jgi:WD40 repeat protein
MADLILPSRDQHPRISTFGKLNMYLIADKTAEIESTLGKETAKLLFTEVQQRVRMRILGTTEGAPNNRRAQTNPSAEPKVKVFRPELIRSYSGLGGEVNSAVFSPNGSKVLTASKWSIKLWDTNTGDLLYDRQAHLNWIYSAEFSPDGNMVLTASADHTAKLWDRKTGQLLFNLEDHKGKVRSAVFSPDGQLILTASADHTAKIWDSSTGQLLHTLVGHERELRSAVFSPDGSMIVTSGDEDKTAKLWDSKTGQLLHSFKKDEHAVHYATFNLDGTEVLTLNRYGGIKIWHTESRALMHKIEMKNHWPLALKLAPDGMKILKAGGSSAGLWSLFTETSPEL